MIRVPQPSSDEAPGPADKAARESEAAPAATEPKTDPRLVRARLHLKAPPAAPRSRNALRTTAFVVATVGLGMAQMALGDSMALPQVASRSDIDIRIGRNHQSGRIEIYGAIGSRASVRREQDEVIIRLPGQQKPDLGDIRSNPPLGVAGVDLKSDSRASELWLKVKPGYDSHFGRADGAVFVQIDPKSEDGDSNSNAKDGKPLAVNLQDLLHGQPAQTPQNGEHVNRAVHVPVVALQVDDVGGGRQISFPFDGPVAAAVFRRGDSVWVVFDQEVDLRLPPDLKDGMIIQDAQWTHNDGFTALRLRAPTAGSLSAVNDGLVWRVRLGGQGLDNHASQVSLIRDDSAGVPGLNINLAGATRVAWIRDPSVGDRMAVIPARGPVKLVPVARTLLEATIGSTAQGAVVMRMTPDVKVKVDGDLVEVSRPDGLTLSNTDPNANGSDARLDYKNALYPSLANADWSAVPPEGFLARYNALQAAAADEITGGPTGPTKARLSLARFLVGQGMTYEAQGVLDLLTKESPNALNDPQVVGLRVVAKMLSGRYADATGDLASPELASDPAAHLWAGYAETKAGNYADAVKDFKAGLKALDQFPVAWRMKMGAAYAYAALQTKDMTTAQAMIGYAVSQDGTPLDKLGAYLIDARIIEATGDKARALAVYQAVGKASDDSLATPALMHAAMLNYQLGKANADQTLNALDALRFRWRGDDTELQLISDMGQIYLSEGRYREALMVLKSGGQSFMNDPRSSQIQASLHQAFRALFLGGMADGLQPVEALGLFNDFRDLTPIGPDGDEMVRRIVRRLVDVDLLDQAASLLQYQVDNRLHGVAKSSVAADLAAIYLMNHDPQNALQTLWNTRTTLLPKSIMAERQVLEARALSQLNEPDKALDVLGNTVSPDADDVRADVYWQQQDWAKAAIVLERRLGDRYKSDTPLTQAEEGRLIRAGIAYSQIKDQKSLTRLSNRFGKFIATASSPDALRVALAPLDGGTLSARNFAAAAADTDSFAGWVTGMKQKFRARDDAAAKAAGATPQPKA
ncbi:tetratricopeptide repeat protein [Asticcacaulis sp. EMRT-3]|uniref:tetratricopeptide repeat protein n=1 Tax=Asticcacaulis sp. EMRT-3 TaxID=3040349 RepID=UPI0024AF4D34|nr:tetratricopeptide repeat protein [Asticcacaulis sp. EMRT-3]MDI7773805.1 tetratricopeptide repeat protein [Asticcacaulis sp. EMRT-3]